MPKSDIDKLFEDFFGFEDEAPASKPAPAKPRQAKKSKNTLTPEAIEAAARAVDAAVREYLEQPRARKKVNYNRFRPVAAQSVGWKRLVDARYNAILDRGTELGLFEVDRDSAKHPFIIPLEPVYEDPSDAEDEEESQPFKPVRIPLPPPPPDEPPKDWDPPMHMDCGHWNWQNIPRPKPEEPEGEPKKSKGMGQVTSMSVRVDNPDDCHYCRMGRPGSPIHQKGKYRKPVPESQRRTPEKERSGGWPGYCCDDEGYYIGGLANNCRYENPKGPWCQVHQSHGKRRKES
jgi:hypothetical protein